MTKMCIRDRSAYHYKITNLITYYSDPVTYEGEYDNINAATIKGVEWTGKDVYKRQAL